MSAPKTINGTNKALDEAQAKGAHTVRVHVDVLEALLNGYTLLAVALEEAEKRKAENGND